MILETERIKLIPPAYTYLDKLFEVHHDPLNQKYNPAGPVETVEELKKNIIRMDQTLSRPRVWLLRVNQKRSLPTIWYMRITI